MHTGLHFLALLTPTAQAGFTCPAFASAVEFGGNGLVAPPDTSGSSSHFASSINISPAFTRPVSSPGPHPMTHTSPLTCTRIHKLFIAHVLPKYDSSPTPGQEGNGCDSAAGGTELRILVRTNPARACVPLSASVGAG
jgi:hypothetical protein